MLEHIEFDIWIVHMDHHTYFLINNNFTTIRKSILFFFVYKKSFIFWNINEHYFHF